MDEMTLFDGQDCLPADLDTFGKILLREIQPGSMLFDVVDQSHGEKCTVYRTFCQV